MTPILGVHLSVAGGVDRALHLARTLRCGAVQIFTRNQRRWDNPPLDPEAVARFRALAPGFDALFSHGSYLVNLAAPDRAAWTRSWKTLADELERAATLGLSMVVVHPGSHLGSGAEAGIRRVVRAVGHALDQTDGSVRLLFESTAGGGNTLGGRLEELRDLLDASAGAGLSSRVGVCLDTCHLFAAGYDLRNEASYRATLASVRDVIGLAAIRAIHLNDSAGDLGSHIDRHLSIGHGRIGREGFRLLVRDTRLARVPMCLETPKGDGLSEDRRNLATLRRLAKRVTPSPAVRTAR